VLILSILIAYQNISYEYEGLSCLEHSLKYYKIIKLSLKIIKMEDKNNLDELKKQYEVFRQNYGLPEFSELNEIFDIEEIDVETDFLLRKIRRVVSERIVGYLRFFEIILNPANAPMFAFKMIKKLEEKDKQNLGEVYEKLGTLEFELVKLDLEYSEEKEVEFIKKVHKTFLSLRKDILVIVNKMLNGGKGEEKERGSYLG